MVSEEEKAYKMLKYLNVHELIMIHDECVKYGETWDAGIRDYGSLEHLIYTIRQLIDKRANKIKIAAKAMNLIIKEHPYWDGNHRSAFETAQIILRVFGYKIEVTKKESEPFIKSVDAKNLSEDEIKKWIQKNLRKIV